MNQIPAYARLLGAMAVSLVCTSFSVGLGLAHAQAVLDADASVFAQTPGDAGVALSPLASTLDAGVVDAVDAAAYASPSAAASGEPEASQLGSDEHGELGTVIVTGVRGGPPRTVADSPAPIDIVTVDELKRTGRTEVSEAIAKVLPSMNFNYNQAGITATIRPVSNRGLGPAYTLVLVNGKRRHNGAQVANATGDTSGVNPVDLDMIPISSIDHIEVLKDSAAAQYGSDAVAGVVNIVLKKDPEGGRVGLMGGRLYGGKGDLNSVKIDADKGLKLGKNGILHVGADARFRGMAWWNFKGTQGPYYPKTNPKNATWNGDGAHNGDPEVDAANLFYNLDIPIEKWSVYSFGTLGVRRVEIGNNFRRPDGLANFSTIYPDGYFPRNDARELDFQLVAGTKGELWGASIDLSSSYGRDNVIQYANLSINPSLGPTTPRHFDNLATYRFQQYVQDLDISRGFAIGLAQPLQVSAGLEFRTDIFTTLAGQASGYTNGGYRFQPGDQEGDPHVGALAAPGAQGAVVLQPQDAVNLHRNVLGAYVDLGIYPLKQWYNGLAGRVEHYSDSGFTSLGGKYNGRIDFFEQFALRGTIGTGFRAPSLSQIGYSQTDNRTNTNPITGVSGPSSQVLPATTSQLARELGAKTLKPERSVNFALGTVLTPIKSLNITVDAYQVAIDHRIGRVNTLLGPAIAPILIANGYTGSEYVRYFANQTNTRTRGIDIVGDWSGHHARYGDLDLSVAFNFNKTVITKVAKAPSALTSLPKDPSSSTDFYSRVTAAELSVDLPTNKLIGSLRWRKGPFRLGWTTTRYASYNYVISQMPAQDRHFGAKALCDIDVTWSFWHRLDVSIGAQNLFNVRPDKNGILDPQTATAGQVYGNSPFYPGGGFYYGRLVYNL